MTLALIKIIVLQNITLHYNIILHYITISCCITLQYYITLHTLLHNTLQLLQGDKLKVLKYFDWMIFE